MHARIFIRFRCIAFSFSVVFSDYLNILSAPPPAELLYCYILFIKALSYNIERGVYLLIVFFFMTFQCMALPFSESFLVCMALTTFYFEDILCTMSRSCLSLQKNQWK